MDEIYFQFNRYAFPIIIVFGTFGALANELLFFHRRALRATSCALYFRVLSINDLIVLWFNIFSLWLSVQFNINPASQSAFYCKLSQYLTYIFYTLSPYLLVLACFDRFCTSSTNARLRRIATVHIAPFLILSVTIIILAIYLCVPIWSELITTPQSSSCGMLNPTYRGLLAITLLIFYSFIPPLLMILFSGLTLILLRQQRRRIMPNNQARARQLDHQLLKMLFIYITTNIICILPFTITCFIQIYTFNNQFPLQAQSVQSSVMLASVAYATSFYVYTLATPFYRDEFKQLLKDCW